MDGEIAQGNLGQVGKYDLAFIGGQLVVKLELDKGASNAQLVLNIDAKQVLDAIAALGSVEAAIISVIEAAILPKPPAA